VKKDSVEKITRTVVRQFPEMDGVRPIVQMEDGGDDLYLVTYKGALDLPDGNTMKRIVRVVASHNGDVIRMSTSR
jgi:hypothetical protein